MSEQVRVEITSRTVEADLSDPVVVEAGQDLADARESGNAHEVSDAQDAYVRALKAAERTQSFARINGAEFPVEAYGLEHDGGRVLVSLVVEASSFQYGAPPSSPQARPADEKPPASTWGAPGRPDPRANIPGWKPEQAPVQVHLNPSVDYTPGLGDRLVGEAREHITRTGGSGMPA